MKVKRYVGETAQEAMQKVRSDLGRDAIILNTRKIRRKGLLGFFVKPLIEVVATIDSDIASKPVKQASPSAVKPVEAPNFMSELHANLMQQQTKVQAKQQTVGFNAAADEEIMPSPVMKKKQPESIEDFSSSQINEIKSMLSKVYDAVKVDYESSRLSDVAKDILEKLEKNEIEKAILNDIKKDILEQLSLEEQQNEELVKNSVHDILDRYIQDPEPYSPDNKKVIVFIGPTGVGKTTTLAKLAANMVLNEKKKVGLVTSDTYRIAAVEQLKTYSEIIGVPLSIIYTPNEIVNAINSYKDKDIVLVDTAGRSHKDQYQLMELKSLLKSSVDFETYLVISATTKFSDCVEIIKSYSFLEDYKLLFTKLDETSNFGTLLNISYVTKKPISYITTGQSVPDDIEIADKEKIINALMGDK